MQKTNYIRKKVPLWNFIHEEHEASEVKIKGAEHMFVVDQPWDEKRWETEPFKANASQLIW